MKELMTEQVIEKELEIVMPEEESEVTEKVKRNGFWQDNRGVGVVEIILILVVIFTINMGCK